MTSLRFRSADGTSGDDSRRWRFPGRAALERVALRLVLHVILAHHLSRRGWEARRAPPTPRRPGLRRLAALLGLVLAACADTPPCLPGSSRACEGPAACLGTETCDGVGEWGPCACGQPLTGPCAVDNGGCDPLAWCSVVANRVHCTCPETLGPAGRRCHGWGRGIEADR